MFKLSINLGDIAGCICLDVDNRKLAENITFLFETDYNNCDTAPQLMPENVSELDWQLDKLIRASMTAQLATTHSSAIVAGHSAIAIMGTSHTGKTTLGLGCALSGFSYLGDEYGFLDLTTGLFSQVKYPLCLREGTFRALDLKMSSSSIILERPDGEMAYMLPVKAYKHIKDVSSETYPLKAVVIPCRNRLAQAVRLEALSVADWPKDLMPSIDAAMPRNILFKKFLRLCSLQDIAIYRANYCDINDGVSLVKEVADLLL